MLTHVILTATDGELKSEVFVFGGDVQVVIGRSAGCSLRLLDPTASRRHCLIDAGGEVVWVRDLGSLNGTYVNGQLVGRRPDGAKSRQPFRELHDGDELRVGNHVFRVTLAMTGDPEEEEAGEKEGARHEPGPFAECA